QRGAVLRRGPNAAPVLDDRSSGVRTGEPYDASGGAQMGVAYTGRRREERGSAAGGDGSRVIGAQQYEQGLLGDAAAAPPARGELLVVDRGDLSGGTEL